MSLTTFLNDTLLSLSLKLGTIRKQSLRTAICTSCERIIRWNSRSPSVAHDEDSLQELRIACRNAGNYCREAGLSWHANRFLKVAEHLSQLLNQQSTPESQQSSLARQLDEFMRSLRESLMHDADPTPEQGASPDQRSAFRPPHDRTFNPQSERHRFDES